MVCGADACTRREGDAPDPPGKRHQSYLPTVEREQRWADRRKRVTFLLFPGYVFVRFRRERISSVLSTPGLVDVVRHNGEPAPVRDDELQVVRTLVEGIRLTGEIPSPARSPRPGRGRRYRRWTLRRLDRDAPGRTIPSEGGGASVRDSAGRHHRARPTLSQAGSQGPVQGGARFVRASQVRSSRVMPSRHGKAPGSRLQAKNSPPPTVTPRNRRNPRSVRRSRCETEAHSPRGIS